MKLLPSVSCLGLLVLLACTGKTRDHKVVKNELDDYFSSYFKPNEPGASVLILKGNKPIYSKSFGLADLKTNEPITAKTLFNLGSISKTFVANGILILEEQGVLSLDDPLSDYFPEFKNKTIADRVTIKHLLTHTSGLPDLRNIEEDSVFYLSAKDEENWAPIMQADSLLFEPGERFEYSNPAFNALALIIEKVSGTKWQHFIAQKIFEPSGMITSTITDGPHPEKGVAHGYTMVSGAWMEDDYGEEPTFAAAGNGGVWSSVDELVMYENNILQAKFLSKNSIDQSRTVYVPDNWSDTTPPFIGWSWFIDESPDGFKIYSHTGTQGGFYCHYVSIPEKQIQYIMLANRYYKREECYDKVMRIVKEQNWFDK